MDLDPSMKEGEARDFLALFDFRGDEVYQKIATLSGGEKGRLSLARIVFGGANLLLLDEPTNHLDLDAREALEDALLEFEGAIVFVSHDRWFVDRIATQILEIAPGGAVEVHDGNYSEMVRRKKEQERNRGEDKEKISLKGKEGRGAARAAGAQPGAAPAHTPSKKSSSPRLPLPLPLRPAPPTGGAQRTRESSPTSRRRSPASRRRSGISTLSLADPDVYRDGEKARGVSAARDAARKALEAKLWDWEETSRKLEAHEVTA